VIRGAQPSVWVLRAVITVGVMVSLLAGVWDGYTPPVALVVVVAMGALFSPFRPEHLSLTITSGLVVFWWALQLRGEVPGPVLVVAAALIATHVAATLLAYGPPALPVQPDLALLWTARGALAWLAALVVWVVARTYTGHGTPSLFMLSGLAAAVIASVVAGVTVAPREAGARR